MAARIAAMTEQTGRVVRQFPAMTERIGTSAEQIAARGIPPT
jgi:hypothetical protein